MTKSLTVPKIHISSYNIDYTQESCAMTANIFKTFRGC